MPRTKNEDDSYRPRPAITPEDRENQVIAAAMDLAEKQIREGTASSQVITYFLKRGSAKEKLEQEILEEQKKLISAKTENLQYAQETKALFEAAMDALTRYRGGGSDDPENDKVF